MCARARVSTDGHASVFCCTRAVFVLLKKYTHYVYNIFFSLFLMADEKRTCIIIIIIVVIIAVVGCGGGVPGAN